MANRYRMLKFTDYEGLGLWIREGVYQGTYRNWNAGGGKYANYTTQFYTERNYYECAVSAKHHLEDEVASIKYRADIYNPQSVTNQKLDPNLMNDSTGWWPGSHCHWTYEKLYETGVDWQFDTYNRNVIFQKMPEMNNTEADRAKYFIDQYGHHMYSRGTYVKTLSCQHSGQPHLTIPGKDEDPFLPIDRDGLVETSGRSHPYHHYADFQGGSWNQIIMDYHYQMLNTRHGRGRKWWPNEYPYWHPDSENDTEHNYFDCLTWIYTYATGDRWQNVPGRFWPGNDHYSSGEYFYEEMYANDRDCDWFVHSVVGAYHPGRGLTGNGEFHLCFSPFTEAVYFLEVRYAFEDMHAYTEAEGTSGFDAVGLIPAQHCLDHEGNPLLPGEQGDGPGTGVMPFRYWAGRDNHEERNTLSFWTDYVDISQAVVQPDGKRYVWFAIRPQEATWDENDAAWGLPGNVCGPWNPNLFRQICIPITDDVDEPGILPPHLKD